MAFLRVLFFLGLVLVVVHRIIFSLTPVWFDVFVAAYLFVVTALVAIVLFAKKRKKGQADVDKRK